MINIGSYVLDQEEMTLSLAGESVKLEPKVLAVLTYFYQNENRYISMAELHEKVWQDRCVSDAAVRRIIGKLRLLFNDDHKAPNYIQSLPKRGYKLICQISFSDDEKVIPSTNETTPAPAKIPLPVPTITRPPTQVKQPSHTTKISANNDKNTSSVDWLSKSLGWGNKTFLVLFILILGLLFIGPLAYRIAALIS